MSTKIGEMLEIRENGVVVTYEIRTTFPRLAVCTAKRSTARLLEMYRTFVVRKEKREIGWMHGAGLDENDRQMHHLMLNNGFGAVFLVAVELQPGLFGLYLDDADQQCLAAYGEEPRAAE